MPGAHDKRSLGGDGLVDRLAAQNEQLRVWLLCAQADHLPLAVQQRDALSSGAVAVLAACSRWFLGFCSECYYDYK